jgi:nicotinamide phosphoribosyltransferase
MFDIPVPFPLMADAYTISSDDFASEDCKKLSVYNMINRKSPQSAWPDVAQDSRMVMYGVSHYIRSWLQKPVTLEDVYESQLFMNRAHSFGGPLNFPFDMWDSVVHDCKGFLPLEISALKEASTFFPNVPYVQVRNTLPGFGELAAHIEATMLGMVSLATARATFTRHWLNQLREWVRKDLPTDNDEVLYQTAQWLLHDFGMRASSCPEESLLFGLTHLLSFHGTDTFNSAYVSWKLGAKSMSGTSLLASAHRNIQGYVEESDCHDAVHKAGNRCNVNITSNVSDCYNYFLSVVDNMVRLADKYPDSIKVARPDSGNALENILHILRQGRKNLRYIEGNGQKPKSMFEVLQGILDAGFKCTQHGIFGVGGTLRNEATRDAMSSKWALANTNGREVVKFSEEIGKMTVPGPNLVFSTPDGMKAYLPSELKLHGDGNSTVINNEIQLSELVTYYTSNEDGPTYTFNCFEKFCTQQDRCITDFDYWEKFAKANPNYGLNRETLSDGIIKVQDDLHTKYNVGV